MTEEMKMILELARQLGIEIRINLGEGRFKAVESSDFNRDKSGVYEYEARTKP